MKILLGEGKRRTKLLFPWRCLPHS